MNAGTVDAPEAPIIGVAPALGLSDLWKSQQFKITDEELGERARASIAGDPLWDDFTRQMINASCAFFAQEVLTGPPEPPPPLMVLI